MKVLIVEDSKLLRDRVIHMLSAIVELENISQAKDVHEAINSFQQLHPDVVIMDIRMPGGSGIDVLKEIKRNSRPPVAIVFTNYPYPQYRRKYIEAGADFFFDKSIEFDKVTEVFRQLIQNQSRQ